MLQLQQRYGNQAVMRMMATSSAGGPADVQPFFGGIAAGVGNVIAGASDTASNVATGVGNALNTASDAAQDVAGDTARATFEAAINAAGLPADEIMSFIDNAGDAASTIFSDPVSFANNLVQAIVRGFTSFVENLTGNLKDGAMEWLLGGIGDLNIDVPDNFSLASVFSLVVQVMGITWNRLEERVIERFGRPALHTFRRVGGKVKSLLSVPAKLFDLVGDRVEDVMVKVKSLLVGVVQKVVRPALNVIQSLLPTAQTLVSAVQTIYKAIQFLKNAASKVAGFMTTVAGNVASIAGGAISDASGAIYNVLRLVIPKVLGFLADQIGLNGIAGKIADIINAISGLITDVIDRLIDFVMSDRDDEQDAAPDDNSNTDKRTISGRFSRAVPRTRSLTTRRRF